MSGHFVIKWMSGHFVVECVSWYFVVYGESLQLIFEVVSSPCVIWCWSLHFVSKVGLDTSLSNACLYSSWPRVGLNTTWSNACLDMSWSRCGLGISSSSVGLVISLSNVSLNISLSNDGLDVSLSSVRLYYFVFRYGSCHFVAEGSKGCSGISLSIAGLSIWRSRVGLHTSWLKVDLEIPLSSVGLDIS